MRHNGQEPDDIRQLLAEQDLLAGLKVTLQGLLADDPLPASDNGIAALKALMKGYKEPVRTLGEPEAARWLGLKPESLARRRRKGTGPVVHENWGSAPRYTVAALEAWRKDPRRQ